MPRHKPLGWPKLMVAKRLKSGLIAYYWAPPTWALGDGCTLRREALGTDYAIAKQRCDELLNPQPDSWRKREEPNNTPRSVPGTFDWLVLVYKSSPKFSRLPEATRRDYDRSLELVAGHLLKDGRRFGSLALKSITPGAADRLHDRIREGGKGQRVRTAKLCMDVCRRAWHIGRREKPAILSADNPFAKMGIAYRPNLTRAATFDGTMRFVAKADELGHASLGTAALISFFLLQRAEDIFLRLAWSHYRLPTRRRRFACSTTRRARWSRYLCWTPWLLLFPELVARLDAEPRRGSLIVMRDAIDPKRRVHLPWATSASNPLRHVQRVVSTIRDAAGLPADITFTSFITAGTRMPPTRG